MPFPFVPPTTSHLTFQNNFTSTTHPSLPPAATSQRNILRTALKSHKRLSTVDQSNNLSNLVAALTDYLKYIFTIDYALSGKQISGEEVDVALAKEIEVEWRPTLSASSVPGREADRVKGRGIDYEISFVHQTYAIIQNLIARQSLLGLYAATVPTPEQRVALIQSATKALKIAHSIHTFLIQRATLSPESVQSLPSNAPEVHLGAQSALQRLTAAEINLLCVLKDDPYPALLVQSRNQEDKEWMIKAPDIPKVRAQVLTRLCVGAAEHAAVASAGLKSELTSRKISKDLIEYIDDVRRTARARACRFQALDSDLAGQTGKAIAWLHAGLNELGIEGSTTSSGSGKSSSGSKGFSKLKSSWNEKREDRRIVKGSSRWGVDGGKAEEGRILEYLNRKFSKVNDTINVQIVPEWRPLLALLPSGMNMPMDEKWKVVVLGEDDLVSMRAPPDDDVLQGESSGEDEGGVEASSSSAPAGAFPGTKEEYTGSTTSYY